MTENERALLIATAKLVAEQYPSHTSNQVNEVRYLIEAVEREACCRASVGAAGAGGAGGTYGRGG